MDFLNETLVKLIATYYLLCKQRSDDFSSVSVIYFGKETFLSVENPSSNSIKPQTKMQRLVETN